MEKIRVGLVDPQTILRTLLHEKLSTEDGIHAIFEVGGFAELRSVLQRLKVDVLISEGSISSERNWEIFRELSSKFSRIRWIILTEDSSNRTRNLMLRSGVSAYLTKDCLYEELVDEIFNVHFKGIGRVRYSVVEKPLIFDNPLGLDKANRFDLTDREIRVLRHICDGKTSNQIADYLCCSVKLIEFIRTNIYKKMEVQNIALLVRKSIENQIIEV
jgi:DNA-binding NarL/FixJ family response regulator